MGGSIGTEARKVVDSVAGGKTTIVRNTSVVPGVLTFNTTQLGSAAIIYAPKGSFNNVR
ncbi:MAG: hypothetical protein IJ608_09025 [Lachnospiraceae bacterium]|nr:hypothetical protein [Lachnospiraceae bacterium]